MLSKLRWRYWRTYRRPYRRHTGVVRRRGWAWFSGSRTSERMIRFAVSSMIRERNLSEAMRCATLSSSSRRWAKLFVLFLTLDGVGLVVDPQLLELEQDLSVFLPKILQHGWSRNLHTSLLSPPDLPHPPKHRRDTVKYGSTVAGTITQYQCTISSSSVHGLCTHPVAVPNTGLGAHSGGHSSSSRPFMDKLSEYCSAWYPLAFAAPSSVDVVIHGRGCHGLPSYLDRLP